MPEDPIAPEPSEPTAVTEPIPTPPVAPPPVAAAPAAAAAPAPYPPAASPAAAYPSAPAAPVAGSQASVWRRGPWWGYLVAGLIGLIIGAAVCGGLVAIADHVGRGDDHGRFQRFDHRGQQGPRQFGPGQRPGQPFGRQGGGSQSTPTPATPTPTQTS